MGAKKIYQYYQPNKKDLKDTQGDCVIRALTKALNEDWTTIFDKLVPIARENMCMPNSQTCWEPFLASNGFEYHGISNAKGTKRPTVESFTKEHKTGVYVLRVAHHIVCVADGKYYDTWDSGYKSLYGYWEMKNNG